MAFDKLGTFNYWGHNSSGNGLSPGTVLKVGIADFTNAELSAQP